MSELGVLTESQKFRVFSHAICPFSEHGSSVSSEQASDQELTHPYLVPYQKY